MYNCYLCDDLITEEWVRNPITGVDAKAGDWTWDENITICPDCYDAYCVKNDIGTLEEALAQGINITYYPFD